MQFFALSDRGRVRETNQDACIAKKIKDYTVLILADGMGGHYGGEIASQNAIESIVSHLENGLAAKMIPGQIMLLLSEALDEANKRISSFSPTTSSCLIAAGR